MVPGQGPLATGATPLPKPAPSPSPLLSPRAGCFGDRPSRSREFTTNSHPGRSSGSASRAAPRGRPPAILVGGTKRPTCPHLPELAAPQHHHLISFPHQSRAPGPWTSVQTQRSQNCGSTFLPSLQPQPPCPHPHIRPALRAHNFKGLFTFLGQNFIAFGQRPL